MRHRFLTAALSMGLILMGCGKASQDGTTADTQALPTGADQLVLRMDYSPGFARVPEHAPLPAFSLYGDGRIVTADSTPNAAAAPGGWQRARESRTDPAGIRRLWQAARAAGLAEAPTQDQDQPPSTNQMPDAPSARFLLVEQNGRRHSLTAGAPEAHDGALRELFRALNNSADWLGGLRTDPYRADALAVLRRDEPSPVAGARHWPLGSLAFPGTELGRGQRVMVCLVLRGEQAAGVTAAAAGAPQSTQWTDGTLTATLELRPLLPDENDCRDLPK